MLSSQKMDIRIRPPDPRCLIFTCKIPANSLGNLFLVGEGEHAVMLVAQPMAQSAGEDTPHAPHIILHVAVGEERKAMRRSLVKTVYAHTRSALFCWLFV